MTNPNGQWLYVTEANAGELQQYHRPDDLTVVHYAASVAEKTFPQAATGLLTALGKNEDVTGMRMHPSDGVNALPVWLLAHQTKVVIISRTQSWQRPSIVLDLVRLLSATPVTVVLAADPNIPNDLLHQSLLGMTPLTITAKDLPDLLPAADSASSSRAPASEPIDLPACDWPTFRYECREVLSGPDFARVDAAYTGAYLSVRAELTQIAPCNEATRERLQSIVLTHQDTATATAAMRGTQAAYFEASLSLRLSPARIIALHAHARTPEFTDRDWTALRAYRDPARPAICTLHAHGHTIEQIQRFTIADANDALETGYLNDRLLGPHARTYLSAHLLHRGLEGGHLTDPFITNKTIVGVLNNAGRDVGILTAGQPVHTSPHTKANWKAGIGFLLKELT